MISIVQRLYDYRELLLVLAWKNITLRYKQSYLGVAWAIFRPMALVAIFMLVRSFVGIDSGAVPYALLTYCAMVPWVYFQDASSEGVGSIVNNANLIKKIYFPREVFPVSSLLSKLLELGVGLLILTLMMVWYQWPVTWHVVWVPFILIYTMLAALSISLVGAALNVFSRDISQVVPLLLSMLMYVSPVMYPIHLVQRVLLEQRIAGDWSEALYLLYTLNPMAGIIDAMQRTLLMGQEPAWSNMLPGAILILVLLPLSYAVFKRAESYFADVI